MSDRVARRALVSGRVQGVGFRWQCRETAESRQVAGWVRNLPDGRVEAWIEGDSSAVDGMLQWLRRGPRSARVERVEVFEESERGIRGFELL